VGIGWCVQQAKRVGGAGLYAKFDSRVGPVGNLAISLASGGFWLRLAARRLVATAVLDVATHPKRSFEGVQQRSVVRISP